MGSTLASLRMKKSLNRAAVGTQNTFGTMRIKNSDIYICFFAQNTFLPISPKNGCHQVKYFLEKVANIMKNVILLL